MGNSYRCIITDERGIVLESDPAQLLPTGYVAGKIITQPSDQTGSLGDVVSFTVVTEGTNLKYRWQFAKANSDTWYYSSLGGYNTNTLSFTVDKYEVGNSYRCIITDQKGNVLTSDPAQLLPSNYVAGKIITQPADQCGNEGDTVTFRVVTEGSNLKYRWQFAKKNSTTWYYSSLGGYNTDTLSFTVDKYEVGNSYRCVITDEKGNVLYTDAAMLLPSDYVAGRIITQPSDQAGTIGDVISFTIECEGSNLKYRWQFAKKNSTTWYYSSLGGYNTDTLTFTVDKYEVGNSYRCVITDEKGNVIYSDAAALVEFTPYFTVDGVEYFIDNNTLEIVGYTGTAASLTIPATVNGMTVVRVGDAAFTGNTTLTSIDLPDSIQTIGSRAFAGCTKLSEIK